MPNAHATLCLFLLLCPLLFALPAFNVVEHSPEIKGAHSVFFDTWAKAHEKEFDTPEEMTRAFAVFVKNTELVMEMNKAGDVEYSVNKFGDWTPEEFAATILMPSRTPPKTSPSKLLGPLTTNDLPESFDWREHGAVTDVYDQGCVGSCFAFSAVQNIEGQWFLANNTLPSLSAEQIVDCDNLDCGEFGGWPNKVFEYVIKTGGIESSESYPYCSGLGYGKPGSCMPCMPRGYDVGLCGNHSDLYCDQAWSDNACAATTHKELFAAHVRDWVQISEDEEQIKAQLVQRGPLSIALDASEFQFYHKGVFNSRLCSKTRLNHAVLLVGYGTEKTLFGKEKPYWIVKNSWGAKWGEQGYIRMARGTGLCGMNTFVTSAVV